MQFHVIAFEGCDPYSRAGGLASRVDGLTRTLAGLGFETHLWFVGDPDAPGYELRDGVHLHRWCQWLSREHRGGVYEGEDAKRSDLTASLPPHLVDQVLLPHLRGGGEAAILAEEWHTADCVVEIDRRLREAGLRERTALLWNANNVFGFDRIPWKPLESAATLTTVSRAMRQAMHAQGVRPLVIANGLPAEAFVLPHRRATAALHKRLRGRLPLVKVARWDPDKNWIGAVRSTAELKRTGERPLLLARGGSESHEAAVRDAARSAGLRWLDCHWDGGSPDGLLEALGKPADADVVCLRAPLDGESVRLLFRVATAVLADSRFEPFGLVGLETMAVGGIACTGMTGEDYATPGRNALVLQTGDPRELALVLGRLHAHPDEERALRRAARFTARQYAWDEIVKRVLLPRLDLLRSPADQLKLQSPAGRPEASRTGG